MHVLSASPVIGEDGASSTPDRGSITTLAGSTSGLSEASPSGTRLFVLLRVRFSTLKSLDLHGEPGPHLLDPGGNDRVLQ